jgi:hypothetical protein
MQEDLEMFELTLDELELIEEFYIPMTIIEIGGTYWGVVTDETFLSLMLAWSDLV